jgi:hypothetical protein
MLRVMLEDELSTTLTRAIRRVDAMRKVMPSLSFMRTLAVSERQLGRVIEENWRPLN